MFYWRIEELEAEQEARIKALLSDGVDVKNILPYKYHKRRLYYEIHLHYPKNTFLIVIERKNTDLKEDPVRFRIVKIFQLVRGERKPSNSTLMYARVILEPSKFTYCDDPKLSKFNLNGKLYLSAARDKKETF